MPLPTAFGGHCSDSALCKASHLETSQSKANPASAAGPEIRNLKSTEDWKWRNDSLVPFSKTPAGEQLIPPPGGSGAASEAVRKCLIWPPLSEIRKRYLKAI